MFNKNIDQLLIINDENIWSHLEFPVMFNKQDSNEQSKTPGYQFSVAKKSKHVTWKNSSRSAMPLLITPWNDVWGNAVFKPSN